MNPCSRCSPTWIKPTYNFTEGGAWNSNSSSRITRITRRWSHGPSDTMVESLKWSGGHPGGPGVSIHLQQSGLCGSVGYIYWGLRPLVIPPLPGMGSRGAIYHVLCQKWTHRGEKPHLSVVYADNTRSDVWEIWTVQKTWEDLCNYLHPWKWLPYSECNSRLGYPKGIENCVRLLEIYPSYTKINLVSSSTTYLDQDQSS